jgi:uncharacterized RDD family membrane protein YckC
LNDQPAPAAPGASAGLGRRLGSLCYETLLLAAILFISGWAITPETGIYRYLFALIGCGLCGLGLAWALFDRDRRFLHDRLAGTRLVRIED